MKKVFIILAVASLWACDGSIGDNFDGDNNPEINIESIVKDADGSFDDALLVEMLCTKGVELIQTETASDVDRHVNERMIFTEEGVCNRLFYDEDIMIKDPDNKNEMIVGKVGGCQDCGKHVYMSRDWKWSYDSEKNILTTTDDYGNISNAEIVFVDECYLAYKGNICAQKLTFWQPLQDDAITIAKFIDDRTSWVEDAVSHDIHILSYVDFENDKRWNALQDMINMNVEIDDQAFERALLGKVMYFGNDYSNISAGCCYGEISTYFCIDGIMRWSDVYVSGFAPVGIYVMMDNGCARMCTTLGIPYIGTPHEGEDVFYDYKWEYKADNNTLYLGYELEHSAEVLYFDGEVAVLKGYITDAFTTTSEYVLYYVDFGRLDRDAVLEQYSTNLLDLI